MLYERHPSEFIKPYNISEKVWTLHGDINKISTSKKYTRNSLQKIDGYNEFVGDNKQEKVLARFGRFFSPNVCRAE